MNIVTAIFLGLLSLQIYSSEDLLEIRKMFFQAAESEDASISFQNKLEKIDHPSNTIKGYKAMTFMFKAKYSWNPIDKYDYFVSGKTLLEKAIRQDHDNMELRYLRMTIQYSVPSVLGYSEELAKDKKFIIENWNATSDKDLKHHVRKFLIESDLCNSEERIIISN